MPPHTAVPTSNQKGFTGNISDEGGRMDVNYLAKLVYMMSHKKIYKPDKLAIKKEYLFSFSKDGKLEEADHGPEGFDEADKEEQACAWQPKPILPLCATPERPAFTRTSTPTSPHSPLPPVSNW
jgi:hypothetical protein